MFILDYDVLTVLGRHVIPIVHRFYQFPESYRLLQDCQEEAYGSRVCFFGVSPCD